MKIIKKNYYWNLIKLFNSKKQLLIMVFKKLNLPRNCTSFIHKETTFHILVKTVRTKNLFLPTIINKNLISKNIYQKVIKIIRNYCPQVLKTFQMIIYRNFKTQPRNILFHNIIWPTRAYYKTSLVILWDSLLKIRININRIKYLILEENLHQLSSIVTQRDCWTITGKML